MPVYILVTTDKSTYYQGEWVTLRVENRSKYPILFQDQSFGLRAFRYDVGTPTWVFADLGTRIVNPQETEVLPGKVPTPENTDAFSTDFMDKSLLNQKIRLLVEGKENLGDRAGQVCAAYTDIVVMPSSAQTASSVVLTLSATATTLKVGDSVTVIMTLSNPDYTALRVLSFALQVQSAGGEPLVEAASADTALPLQIARGESNSSIQRVFRASHPGSVSLTGSVNYAFYANDDPRLVFQEASSTEPLCIVVIP